MARQETTYESDLNLKATELRLGLPGSDEPEKELAAGCGKNNKRCLTDDSGSSENSSVSDARNKDCSPPSKAQVVGWPPIRSYRKNSLQAKKSDQVDGTGMYLKVSMDGAPYLRKIDLNTYKSYSDLLQGLQNMFKVQIGQSLEKEGYKGSDFAPTYEDKDGDWMLVGDVPWDMFIGSCKRLRIMKSSDAKGLGSWV